MNEMITLCGDNCLSCPRYNAKNSEELERAAELWHRIGWRDKVVANNEIACTGCSSHTACTYNLVECIKEHSVKKCNQCSAYPCGKIKGMLQRSAAYQKTCQEKCTEEEYRQLSRAFFEKEKNLQK